jgi:hypothetical protein
MKLLIVLTLLCSAMSAQATSILEELKTKDCVVTVLKNIIVQRGEFTARVDLPGSKLQAFTIELKQNRSTPIPDRRVVPMDRTIRIIAGSATTEDIFIDDDMATVVNVNRLELFPKREAQIISLTLHDVGRGSHTLAFLKNIKPAELYELSQGHLSMECEDMIAEEI